MGDLFKIISYHKLINISANDMLKLTNTFPHGNFQILKLQGLGGRTVMSYHFGTLLWYQIQSHIHRSKRGNQGRMNG